MKRTIKMTDALAAFGLLAVCTVFVSCFDSCDVYPGFGKSGGRDISVVSWNVQAMFDGKDDGWEYEEYRDGSGWNVEKYEGRLNSIARAIQGAGEKTPDVIVLIEVENRGVMEALHRAGLDKAGYTTAYFASNEGYSLGIGVLSKLSLTKMAAHSINIDGKVIPRPVAEICFNVGGEEVALFACHWKSKLGGEAETESLRREAAKVILRRQREICEVNPDAAIVIVGDLNENYDEFYRRGGAAVTALMPDDPEASILAGYYVEEAEDDEAAERAPLRPPPQDFLILSEGKPPVSAFFATGDGVFYSPWGEELANGSYFYSGSWETIDHILLNTAFFDKKGVEFQKCYVIDSEPFVNSKGEPNKYNPRTGSGLSDHLPLLLTLTFLND